MARIHEEYGSLAWPRTAHKRLAFDAHAQLTKSNAGTLCVVKTVESTCRSPVVVHTWAMQISTRLSLCHATLGLIPASDARDSRLGTVLALHLPAIFSPNPGELEPAFAACLFEHFQN